MSHSESEETSFLAQHPRMMGVLFMLLVLLTQVGAAAGAVSSANPGP
ncbi:hypothetical protein HLRTI_002425 [Halorhabdus tiamatea SARL4B]|uniref:Uncharacterized protein n=1 Tax=Halorhabdus tiamatea SARL4B TaxID=1033806 RepID=S6D1Q0_9EURY|nr:hypothetical protein [Halorhabdus tiamatea]ERJ05543.1 hypothetical protein HLRTI_002425 [Halorhabdus tiamatea SARL4B]CCQ32540.1 hypothetical protein HTIA_0392 [Halorhabdus tiamatea SARL4B]